MNGKHLFGIMIRLSLAAALLITGCRSLAPQVTYYTLTGLSVSEKTTPLASAASAEPAPVIGIGSVQIPGYVNRLQIVTRSGENQIRMSDNHRWADYPDRMMKQVIGENIQALIPGSRVFGAPWPAAVRPDVTLSFFFVELVAVDQRAVQLVANWTVAGKGSLQSVQAHRTILSEPIDGGGWDARVAAHNRAIEKLCQEVATAIAVFF